MNTNDKHLQKQIHPLDLQEQIHTLVLHKILMPNAFNIAWKNTSSFVFTETIAFECIRSYDHPDDDMFAEYFKEIE